MFDPVIDLIERKDRFLIAGHHLAATPCGAGSPWRRLLDVQAMRVREGMGEN